MRTGNIRLIDTSQGKGFAISILAHLIIVIGVVYSTSLIQSPPKLMVVDFSILEHYVKPSTTKQITKKQAVQVPPVLKPLKKIISTLPKPVSSPKPKIAAIKQKPVPSVKPEPKLATKPLSHSAPQVKEEAPLLAEHKPTPPTPTKFTVKALVNFPTPAAGKAKVNPPRTNVSKYTKAQFSHIQRGIQQHINYPRTARRMGWEGKVVVEFIICEDGTVKNIHILESSGFKALDKNAAATIKKAAPFPIPPIPAKLIIPVVYRLS